MRLSKEALVTATLWLLAPLFLVSAVIGGVRNYSMVPFWDMWPGYLNFYMRVSEGHWAEWWSLHNEHRIVLARILFWMDLAWFDGTVWFLIAVNYLLVFAAFLTFRSILLDRAGTQTHKRTVALTGVFVFICLFSWIQHDNLTWGFQSQFILAQWLPLLAFYLLYQAGIPAPAANRRFVLACAIGILCIGTMASGVMALPLMLAYAIVQRMGWKRVGVLSLLTLVCLAAYFTDYQSTPGHGSVRAIAQDSPVKLLQYVLVYLGSPFYHLLGARSLPVGQLFGLIFVVLSAAKAVEYLKAPRQHALEVSLLTFILYIGGTALGTAAGRLLFGLNQATESRYTTPALMAWMALLILFLPWIIRRMPAWPHRIVWPLLLVLVLLTAYQVKAWRPARAYLFERDVAALALEMGVRDDAQIGKVIFSTELGLQITEKAADANLSVFGLPSIKDARSLIERPASIPPAARCRAVLTDRSDIPNEQRYDRVVGWIAPVDGPNRVGSVTLVNAQGIVVGYALAGELTAQPAPDIGQGLDSRVFKGYVLRRFADPTVRLAATGSDCSVEVASPPPIAFRISTPTSNASPAAVNVGPKAVVSNQGWQGTDYARTSVAGLRVLGSYVHHGDADTGSVALRLQRGAALYYRSGPTPKNQRFRIGDGVPFSGPLPLSDHWTLLVFDNPVLPDEFTLTLTDSGEGWGEWSAIAIKDSP